MAQAWADQPATTDDWIVARLHHAGLRATIARCLVLRILSDSSPLRLDQLVDAVHQQLDGLRAATIRRAVNNLADHRLVRDVACADGTRWRLSAGDTPGPARRPSTRR